MYKHLKKKRSKRILGTRISIHFIVLGLSPELLNFSMEIRKQFSSLQVNCVDTFVYDMK